MLKAYILHTYPWRESSLIVEFLTEDEGRMSLVAKGARRPMSAMRGILMPFNRFLIKYGKKGELKPLIATEWDQRNDICLTGERLFAGFYMNELILKLFGKNDKCDRLFYLYEQTLHNLSRYTKLQEVFLRKFEFHLLKEIGVMPDFSSQIFSDEQYYLSPDRGFISDNEIHMLEGVSSSDFLFFNDEFLLTELATLSKDDNYWSEAYKKKDNWVKIKEVLRFLLDAQLNNVELKSRRIMKDLNYYKRNVRNRK